MVKDRGDDGSVAVPRPELVQVVRPRRAARTLELGSGAPAELGLARDPRVPGVAVRQITLRQGRRCRVLDAADALLEDGFHGFELDNGLRWTDGDAGVPAALFDGFDGPANLLLHLGGNTRYPLFGQAGARAAV